MEYLYKLDRQKSQNWHKYLYRRKEINRKISEHKTQLNETFVRRHKGWFTFLDVLAIICILFNFGAVFITNMTVAKESALAGEEIVLYEVNPVAAKEQDYQIHPNWKILMTALIFFAFKWYVLAWIYFYYRRSVIDKTGLATQSAIVIYFFTVLGYDFFNDLGFLIGMAVF